MTDYLDLRLRYPPVPEHAGDLAELAVGAVSNVSGELLDYSAASLEAVDRLIERLSAANSVESVAETLFCLGCYTGEVLRRSCGGDWLSTDESSMRPFARWPIVLRTPDGYTWNPIGKVFKRFELGAGDSLVHFFEAVTRTTQAGGPP